MNLNNFLSCGFLRPLHENTQNRLQEYNKHCVPHLLYIGFTAVGVDLELPVIGFPGVFFLGNLVWNVLHPVLFLEHLIRSLGF